MHAAGSTSQYWPCKKCNESTIAYALHTPYAHNVVLSYVETVNHSHLMVISQSMKYTKYTVYQDQEACLRCLVDVLVFFFSSFIKQLG